MKLDMDLQSIQEVRSLVAQAVEAAEILSAFTQEKLDRICESIASACMEHAEELAKLAVEETGFGRWEDKVLKNRLGSKITWESVRDMKVVGLLQEDEESGIDEIGVPMGVVAALIPSTNPTSTVMYKSIISVKAGNAIVLSPHPGAKKSITKTYCIVREAAIRAGAPEGAITCLSTITPQATEALLKHQDISIILATGGEAMVHAAYSSGNPALGVGPGNGPCYIERTADISKAVKHIMESKTFDNGTICASEQSIVTEQNISEAVEKELKQQGGYFLTEQQSTQLAGLLLRENGTMNPAIVGRTAEQIADMAGIRIPDGTRLLVARQDAAHIGRKNPYSREKLCPLIAYYIAKDWEDACQVCIRILKNEGAGHTMTIHTQNREVVREFALKKPVSRILVNTPGALGGVGATTGLAPALTLGCGAVGGSATSDNITPRHLINIRRVAYGCCELASLSGNQDFPDEKEQKEELESKITDADIRAITQAVLEQLRAKRL